MYTKGNWTVDSQSIMSGKEFIATVSMNNDEFKANAHLISAAPDMYEALKACEVSLIDDEHYQQFRPLLSTIKQAIAKAEGMKTLGMNTKSDELQTGIQNCIKCGQVYRTNVVSAICPECVAKAEEK